MTLRSRTNARHLITAGVAIALALLVPAIAFGHAVVFPKNSTPGAYERYLLRVPNEKAIATTRVELRVPADVKVNSFAEVPGWQLEVLKDSAQRITGAVWTGTLAPNRFVEFPFVAVNPKTNAKIAWPALQTYADGQVVEWNGPEGSKTPASVTTIAAASIAGGGNVPLWLSIAALILALISLGLAARKTTVR
jgi:uncharacterized protein YcnI